MTQERSKFDESAVREVRRWAVEIAVSRVPKEQTPAWQFQGKNVEDVVKYAAALEAYVLGTAVAQ